MEDEFKALRKMVWMNTTFIWMCLMLNIAILISIWVRNFIVQALAFMIVGLFWIIGWNKISSKIKPYLN